MCEIKFSIVFCIHLLYHVLRNKNKKTRHLHMKAMNHDIHSLFYTLYLDISLFLSNILLIV